MSVEINLSTLLSAVAGIMIFLSLESFITLNGFATFAPIIILLGVSAIIWAKKLARYIPINFISKPLILTFAHVLIFVGLAVYLERYLEHYWIFILAAGILILNNHNLIAKYIADR